MRSLFFIILFLSNLTLALPALAEHDLTLFSTSKAAKMHCPDDNVVWLNTNSGVWHDPGSRWYGNTKHGAYACEKEARAAGDRASLNG